MTAEQAALIHKAQDSLRAARLLIDQAFYDFAVSRSFRAEQFLKLAETLIGLLSFASTP